MDQRKQLTQKNYSGIADLYTADFGADNEHFDEFIDPLIKEIEQKGLLGQIIDLGSGPGNVIDYLLKFNPDNELIAVDFTPEFCKKLKIKYQKNEKVKVVQGDFVQYVSSQPINSVVAYIASYSVIHVPDEEIGEFFKSLHSSLVVGGLFAFSVWEGEKKGMEKEPYQVQHDNRLQVQENLESYLNNFTEDELRERLSKAGFSILKSQAFAPTAAPGEFPQGKVWILAKKEG
jgi:SAM-dependent methyltransferase